MTNGKEYDKLERIMLRHIKELKHMYFKRMKIGLMPADEYHRRLKRLKEVEKIL